MTFIVSSVCVLDGNNTGQSSCGMLQSQYPTCLAKTEEPALLSGKAPFLSVDIILRDVLLAYAATAANSGPVGTAAAQELRHCLRARWLHLLEECVKTASSLKWHPILLATVSVSTVQSAGKPNAITQQACKNLRIYVLVSEFRVCNIICCAAIGNS